MAGMDPLFQDYKVASTVGKAGPYFSKNSLGNRSKCENTSEVGSPEVVNKFLEESPKIKLRHLLALMVRGVCVCVQNSWW